MRKVKWGILGTAAIAVRDTIPGMLQAENCEMTAIAGRNMEKALQFKEKYGFLKAYGSYDELLADEEIEAVYIPLPNEMHCEWTIKALRAKKHVLCEKPLAPNAKQIAEMFAAAKENGVYLMEAFAYLHGPFINGVKEEVAKGTIGEVEYMESGFLTSDYDISNIRMRKETFGGALYDLGCYCTSQILWVLGEEPKKVQAMAEFAENGIDVLTTAIIDFGNRKKATLTTGMNLATEKDMRIDRFRIFGTKGNIRSNVEFNECGDLQYILTVDGEETVKTIPTPQNYKLEVEQLSRCILEGETPYVTEEFSLRNSRLLDAILEKIGY